MMNSPMVCPRCGAVLDVCHYQAMLVISCDLALFSVECPQCNTISSAIKAIPAQLQEEVHLAAREVGAGMGCE
ncbi:UDP-N-acetylmuramoylalanyl-D-glutamate--2,6-diaminopimelate ligase [Adlercreutzia agrestimuris]|uniref:UDP-N-acetylmuramoylalanyl-D-glutamate--2, 6-diaminopimelate ligase n=1 Tax=Adlercreutzia agrestimuris TaxID=2941324 RepID=UPI0020404A27|nr:UDP-N-acetylmuramoylalanyl-D-glutamate--2,6-diaminopimelate ligase [Adlercreutzia agrestimuris]